MSASKIREICIIKINFRGVIQKNDDLNRRFTTINMPYFFWKYVYLFFIVFYCRADPNEWT